MRTTSTARSALVRGRPGRRAFELSYFFAMSVRYHRRIVSGVTMPTIPPSRRRPRALPFTARRRRWSSVRRSRRRPCAARRTRFSSSRYSMTACCCRLTQPARTRTTKASGGGSASMAQACPTGWHGARRAGCRDRAPWVRDRVPKHKPPGIASNTALRRVTGLGGVFAQDGNGRQIRHDRGELLRHASLASVMSVTTNSRGERRRNRLCTIAVPRLFEVNDDRQHVVASDNIRDGFEHVLTGGREPAENQHYLRGQLV